MCRNVTITRCLIDVGDDNVAVKSGKTVDGREFAADGLTVTDCTIKHGHGMSIGSETVGGVKDVVVRNCTFEDTDNGIRIKSDRKRGGTVENVLYENITMKNVRGAITITSYYPKIPATDTAQPVTKTTPAYRNITIRNLTATSTKDAGVIVGLPESPIENVLLENVQISAEGRASRFATSAASSWWTSRSPQAGPAADRRRRRRADRCRRELAIPPPVTPAPKSSRQQDRGHDACSNQRGRFGNRIDGQVARTGWAHEYRCRNRTAGLCGP